MAIDLTLQSQIKNYTNFSSFPATGVVNTIYIADDTNKMYRWDGSAYVEVSSSSGGVWGTISGTLSSQTDLQTALDSKVDKVTGKVLSSNDYTNTDKSKLAGIQAGAEVNVNADWNATSGDAQILNKPTIPTQTSNLTNNGADGVNPFITALDIPTFASADKMVTVGRNSTGSTLYKGTIVYISGSTGNRPNFVKAKADAELTSAGTFGVIESDIANNSDGNCVTIGTINNLDTRTSATNPFTSDTLADGDTIYLSPTTAGYITNVKPSAPNHLVYLGKVVRTSPTNGTIVYRVQNGYELEELHNVAISSVANNDLIQYDSATSLWKNRSLASAGIQPSLGYTPATNTRTISTSSPLSGGGDLSADRTISISQATTSTNGYLSSTDWNTFNGKQSALGYTPEDVANKSTSVDADRASNTKYPSVKSVYDWAVGLFATISQLTTKQDTLVSGTNIKTINGSSVLGSGNLTISGGAAGAQTLVPITQSFGANTLSTSCAVNCSNGTTLALSGNNILLMPFKPFNTFTSFALNINCTVLGLGIIGRILIYSDAGNGNPGTKLYESADLDLSTTGFKTALIAFTFTAGTTYWLAIHTSGAVTLSAISNAALVPIFNNGTTSYTAQRSTSYAVGSAPTTWTASSYQSGAMPLIGIRV